MSKSSMHIHSEVQAAIEDLRLSGRPATSWGEMETCWATFVRGVSRGAGESVYEYVNDLSVRDRIDFVLERSPGARVVLEPEIVCIDAEFVRATTGRPMIIPGGPAQHARWWWYRAPTNISDELRQDLGG